MKKLFLKFQHYWNITEVESWTWEGYGKCMICHGCTGVWDRNQNAFHCVWSRVNTLPSIHQAPHHQPQPPTPCLPSSFSSHCSYTPSHKSLDKWPAHRCYWGAPPPAAPVPHSMGMWGHFLIVQLLVSMWSHTRPHSSAQHDTGSPVWESHQDSLGNP